VIRTSAVTGQGIKELIGNPRLPVRSCFELKADPDRAGRGRDRIARRRRARRVATCCAGRHAEVGDVPSSAGSGRIRSCFNDRGRSEARPSTPVMSAASTLARAGDKFFVSTTWTPAQLVAEDASCSRGSTARAETR
jgi:hypothetical protein